MRPSAVNKSNANIVKEKLFGKQMRRRQVNFKVGDYVRLSLKKGLFKKGYLQNYTEEIFKISKVFKERLPTMYEVEDLKDKDGNMMNWGVYGFFYEKVFLDKDIIKTRDNTLIYYEFKRLFNDMLLDFPDFGYQLKNMLSVSLIEGKVEFEMKDDLRSLGY
eukprot:gene2229-biopygen1992